MGDNAQTPPPSPEVSQLVMLGQLGDAAALYAKQAEIDLDTAREKLSELET
jgi:hypothetical protein